MGGMHGWRVWIISDNKYHTSVTQTPSADAGCPRNIICPPPPPVVVIPNIRYGSSMILTLLQFLFLFRASDIAEAATVALNNIRQRQKFQDALFKKGIIVKKKTSAFAQQRFKQTNRFSSQQGLQALTALETSHQLASAFKLDKDQGMFALPQFSLKGSKIGDTCPVAPTRCIKDAPQEAPKTASKMLPKRLRLNKSVANQIVFH